MSTPRLPVGTRLRTAREKAGRKQAAVAGLCGISVDYLSQIERGLKTPSVDVLILLANELSTSVAYLLDGKQHSTVTDAAIASSVTDALMSYQPAASVVPPAPAALRDRVEQIWRSWQTSQTRFTDVAGPLPNLISDTESAVRAYRKGSDVGARREVLRCAADLYGMLRSYCRRTGRIDLSLMVADRARRAAEEADDPLRVATAQWNLGHVLLGDGQPEGAESAAMDGLRLLQQLPNTAESAAVAGALELVMVTGAARRRDWWAARKRLEERATERAERAGDGNVMWTVFGPTNVDLHRLSIEMEAGETAQALCIADQVDISQLPSRERRFTFTLEVARCYAQRREDAAVLVHLLDLEHLAPQDVTHSPEARQLITDLRTRVRPTYRRQVSALADRLGIT